MFKKLASVLAAAMLTLAAGNAFASFSNGDLIRVVYDTASTKEYATDLGTWSSLTADAATGNVTVGGGADAFTNIGAASVSTLKVAYFLYDANGPTATRYSVSADAGGVSSATRQGTNYASNTGSTLVYYANLAAGATSVLVADKTTGNTYFNKLSGGKFGSWLTTSNGEASLSSLATTGYVDQTIYTWTSSLTGGTAGTAAFTVRTMADGSTVINAGQVATTPIPAAVYLLGSGLLGLFGIRRRGSKA